MHFLELQQIAAELRGRSVSPDPRSAGVEASFWSGAIAVSVSVLA